ncbi:helix-turn-helix domain-containing protein [Kribbella qitaiheensis]|uniref:helix-turn-helix domain-containing protein n=1 Tax=Kribbella qitaiheensis TaxID=1544730 RepID=UPI001623715D|nr:helix-turn-helix transcriptional regulator [Kribbella qitaiheensis]
MAEAAFGVQLRQSRQAAALSLRQLATRVGYDHSYLSQVERGQRPGSAHLARLCDRELNTGSTLTAAHQQTNPLPQTQLAGQSQPLPQAQLIAQHQPVPQVQRAAVAVGVDLLEAVRHGLVESFGQSHAEEEWNAVAADLAAAFGTTPPSDLLPELAAQLQLLPADASATHAVPAAELGVLVALTLTGLGQSRAAGRWWSTSRTSADRSSQQLVMSLVRGSQAISGLTERKPLGELLALADEAVALARAGSFSLPDWSVDSGRTGVHTGASGNGEGRVLGGRVLGGRVLGGRGGCLARGHAGRALVLARQSLAAAAWSAVQDLLAVTDELPAEGDGGVFEWSAWKVHGVEGRVCAELRYPAAGYVVLERALELCPTERLTERAELELCLAHCLMVDGEVATGLALAMRVLVELPDQWHTQYLYDAGGRVLSAVPGKDLGRPAVRDYRELLGRRPYLTRTVGSGSSSAWAQG